MSKFHAQRRLVQSKDMKLKIQLRDLKTHDTLKVMEAPPFDPFDQGEKIRITKPGMLVSVEVTPIDKNVEVTSDTILVTYYCIENNP